MADEFMKAALYWIKTFNKKVKEKIWMEKLIELFKEYVDKYSNDAKVLDEWEYAVIDDGQSFLYWTREYSYLTLISKKFGFIQWLVENDKIDIESYCRITSIERKWEKDVYRDEVDSLLMLLAIQDEPIRFLCEILK